MAKEREFAISPTREVDFPEWYQEVVKASEIAENSPVRGCMVIKPWGYGIWERVQSELDKRIKETGHENAYFPLLIPVSFLEKEATHVEGFAKECAVVTHHRLEAKDGKLVPTAELDEPLVIRPTSETIIGEAFSKWVRSYRDLPLLINQWCNVLRWEMRTRLFLRTAEFLWQEGHTAHVDEECARKEVMVAAGLYRELIEDKLAMPAIMGRKPEGERFPGAEDSISLEAMMQDRKALQAGTSHYLGQNFARAAEIRYLSEKGELEYAHTTSWGVSTRLIGGMVMTHGDDDGLRVPPRVAPKHIVLLPVVPKPEFEADVFRYAEELAAELRKVEFHGSTLVVHIDKRDLRGGEKNWQWVKRGIPLRVELGPRDIQSGQVMLYRRDQDPKEKIAIAKSDLVSRAAAILDEIQAGYFAAAKSFRDANIVTGIKDFTEFARFFTPKNTEKPEIHGGFVKAKWCGDRGTEAQLAELKVTIRCLPLEQTGTEGKCVLTGKPATTDAIFAKAY